MPPLSVGLEADAGRVPEHSIASVPTARTAFVGRTLRGPVNRPLIVKSFAEFQQLFGGLWQPSLLGYAVEQFFDNGGREAVIVRVANGARAATLTLRAGAKALVLQALRPGTREFLRASVDYDNIAPESDDLFNLTVQRVRVQGGAHVEDQEIFQRLSVTPAARTYLPTALAQSALVSLAGAVPEHRPERTLDPASGLASAYVNSNSDGDDGAPLTDYDLIGSAERQTGLFALNAVDFNFLCMAPLSRDKDVGPSALLVAARYCRQRRALLIVDPPLGWHTADDALDGLRNLEFANENAVMFFPRVLAHDKLRGHFESFAPCGAVAGMLARHDEVHPVWAPAAGEEPALRPGFRAACLVSEDKRLRLAALGVNSLQSVRAATRNGVRPRTLAGGSAAHADWKFLGARRLALFILNSIEHGTRWAAGLDEYDSVAPAVTAQVREFFEGLHAAGAFGALAAEDAFFVICDTRAKPAGANHGEFHLIIGFAAARERQFHTFRITHSAAGARVQSVRLNPLNFSEYSPAELKWVDNIASQLQG